MNTWDKFILAYKQYFCQTSNSKFEKQNGYNICFSGTDNYFFNYLFLDNNFSYDESIFNKIDTQLAIFSFPENRKKLSNLSKINFLGNGMIMTKNLIEKKYEAKTSEEFKIIKVHENIDYLEDYIILLSKVKKYNKDEIKKIFNSEYLLSSNVHMYLAFSGKDPVGLLSAVVIEDCAFSVDSAIIEDRRNEKVLTSLGEFALQDGVENKIPKYSCLVTSPHTMKLVEKQGYHYEIPCDVWIYNGK